MGKGKVGAVVICAGMVVGVICVALCTERIPAGYVGVVYSMNGGIQDNVLTQGYHIVSPTKKVTKYSVATEQLYMSADEREGSEEDDSFDVVCKDGKMSVDLEMSYSFDADKVNEVFQRYRGIDGETVMNTIIRGKIKTKVSEVTSEYTVLEAYMEKKAQLNKEITTYLRDELEQYGVTVESATLSRCAVDPAVESAIVQRSKVSQELEIEKQKQEKAKLEAETKIIEAKGDAEKMAIQTEAEAKRYKELSAAITPELIQKWEMEARKEHGWVTIQGVNTIVKDN